jgi:hypothetical protein
MKRQHSAKQKAAIVYAAISFMGIFIQPSENASLLLTIAVPAVTMANLAFAVHLLNRSKYFQNDNATTANRN